MRKPACIMGLLLAALCAMAQPAGAEIKGEALPERTVEIIVDVENRAVENLFGGDAEAARTYVTNVLLAVRMIFSQDLNITLSVKELNVWETPAPFEIPASEEPDTPDVLNAYRNYVLAERDEELPCLFQLFSGNLPSFSSASLAYASQACNGTSMFRLFGTTTFPAGPGSIDVILSARGLGRNLGAASNTTDPSVMAATINGSTPLLFLSESITAIANRLAVGDCWVPVVTEGEGEEPVEICNDGIDNDENGFTDCDDFACVESQFCTGETNCNDGIDNDENGFTDCDDFACAESLVCTESEGAVDGEGAADGEGDPQPEYQSADINLDFVISLSELLRVVQLYNSQGLHCGDANSEDGYVPGSNINFLDCPPHTSDFDPQDWVIVLGELLQLIQLYNANGYEACEAPEGFCPVLL